MNKIFCVLTTLAVLLLQGCGSTSSECAALWNCRNTIKQATYQWLSFSSSASQAQWNSYIHQICNNNQQELSCARQVGCTNSTILTEANIAIGDRNFICSNLGRQAVLRLRTEDNCIGDPQAIQAQAGHREFCYLYRTLITPGMLPSQICSIVNSMRVCDVTNGDLSCSDVSAYIIDQLWLVRISQQFSFCYNEAVSRSRGFPPVSTL
ncbi:hypothetical protein RRG08_003946 [Elysia crispata]|uniref:Lipoprotein n=1 Tax=Elysia crispata TaxID=231223 RepID=A0AAE0YBD4_9GAST|nr:hypothetical protein RRG08_003946 [Elysia crispata]